MKKFILICSLLLVQLINAQGPGCSNVDAGPLQIDLDCTTSCTDLTATFLETGESTSYDVSSISFAPPSSFSGLTNPLFLNPGDEDIWSNIITIPFNFCFFGSTYNQLLVGVNGVLSFQIGNANTGNEFTLTDTLPNNSNSAISEANIFGAAHDLSPGSSAGTHQIGWEVQGTAPCRRFVASYYNVPQFGCIANITTQMIVLYEGTNTIEVYLLDKSTTCDFWFGGNAIVGVQNDAGTQAFSPPGRNTSNWTATNEAWRFTPNGIPNYNLTWYNGSGTAIGSTPTINVCPTADEIFTVEVEYTNCDGSMFTDSDTVNVTVSNSGDASFTMTATCDGGTAVITGDTGGAFTFNPIPTDGATIDAGTGEVTNGTSGTSYTIEYTTTGTCAANSTETVTVLASENASFTMTATCDGGTAVITGDTGGTFIFNPIPTDGATIDAGTGEVTNGISGTSYTIEYTTTGTCAANNIETVTVLASEDASFTMTATCDGGTAVITGDTGGTFTFNPIPTDGATIDTGTGEVTNGISGTSYTIEYTTTGACAANSTETVTILASEDASFTMTATCDGGTAVITGDTGGAFTFNPIPTDGAAIDAGTGEVTNGISGTSYTIEYTTTGTCAANSTETVTVSNAEDASFTMTATCDGGTAVITGDTGGAFTFNPIPTDGATIDAGTGEVTNGTSGITYTIGYTTTGACAANNTETVTVLASEDASFTMTATCDGGTAIITGDTGGTFAFNPIPIDGATIDAGTGEVTNGISGTSYTIEYTTTGACAANSTETVTILASEDASFTMTATCDGGTAVITGDTGGAFTFNPVPTDGATINIITGEVTNAIPNATYSITYTVSGICNTDSQIINFTVFPLPNVDLEDEFKLCLDSERNIINQPIIDTGLSISSYLFEWTEISNPGVVLGSNSYYEPIVAGIYNVFVINSTTGCSTVIGDLNTTTTVTSSIIPSGLNAVIISETFVNENIIEVSVNEEQGVIYEFSLDGNTFESNGTNSFVFYNLSSGEHEVIARDADGCGEESTTVFIIDYPLFFTPNNDGYNDTWQIIGLSNQLDAKIYIFDRYGKLIKQISPSSSGWDGTFKGQPLPSSDYWFSLEYRDPNNEIDTAKKIFKAHFTLKR